MEITLRKLSNMLLQRKRASGMASKEDAVLRPSWRHEEVGRNDLLARKSGNRILGILTQSWQAGGKAKFIYLPPGLMLALAKFFLIDLDLLLRNGKEDKAQAGQFALAA